MLLAPYLTHGSDVQTDTYRSRAVDHPRLTVSEDHPDTLVAADKLASDLRALGAVQTAHDRDQENLARRRRVLGEDHPDTLESVANLAADLRVLRGEERSGVQGALIWLLASLRAAWAALRRWS